MQRGSGIRFAGQLPNRSIPITEATLFVADHAAHLAKVVRPALAEGRLVISDRYSDSRYAYQSVTLQGIIPDPEAWLRAMHNGWTIIPDKTFLCVLPVDEALTRLKPDSQREHFERREVLEKVQNNYLSYARNEPDAVRDCGCDASSVRLWRSLSRMRSGLSGRRERRSGKHGKSDYFFLAVFCSSRVFSGKSC